MYEIKRELYGGQGHVTLVDVIPSEIPEGYTSRDAMIANTARLSKQSGRCKDNMEVYSLISKLFLWGHFSPFEQAELAFEIRVPLIVFWQLDRHRTFKYGSHLRRSGRYAEFTPEDIYIPDYPVTYDTAEIPTDELEIAPPPFKQKLEDVTRNLLFTYKQVIRYGVDRETARFLLPAYCLMYEERMVVDLKNLMHFLSLRTDMTAQREIRELAKAMFDITSEVFPYTMKIFNENHKPDIDYKFGDS